MGLWEISQGAETKRVVEQTTRSTSTLVLINLTRTHKISVDEDFRLQY